MGGVHVNLSAMYVTKFKEGLKEKKVWNTIMYVYQFLISNSNL